jgi:hypothetical protein
VNHPVPDLLEKYALHGLSPETEEIIEEHLLICQSCQKALDADQRYISTIRAAFIVEEQWHMTEDGAVRTWVEGIHGCWAGGISGAQVQSLRLRRTRRGAILSVSMVFREMFPEHRCSESCETSIGTGLKRLDETIDLQ